MQPTPEFRLFCLALRKPQHTADVDALRRALTGPDRNALNWAALAGGARRHRVADLFLAGLEAAGVADASEYLLAALRRRNNAAKRLIIVRGMLVVKLARMFSAAGVRVLTLKGHALSVQLYGDPARREPGDIDLLIDPAQFNEARALLVEAGLLPKGHLLSSRQRAVHRRLIKDETFVHVGTHTSVELHHRLTDNPELLSTDFDALWQTRETISIWGTPVATLSRADLLLYLCAHGGLMRGRDCAGWLT
jgi:putative nucleotidyltransferase-like protein